MYVYEHEAEQELWLLLLRIFYQDIHFSVIYTTIKMCPVRRKTAKHKSMQI